VVSEVEFGGPRAARRAMIACTLRCRTDARARGARSIWPVGAALFGPSRGGRAATLCSIESRIRLLP